MSGSLIVATVLFILGICAESVTSWQVIRGARKRHPALWEHAGRPTLLGNGDLISAWPLVRYFLNRDYMELNDSPAIAFADKKRLSFVATYVLAWAGVATLLLTLAVKRL